MTAWLAPALAYFPQWLDYQVRANRIPGIGFALGRGGKVLLETAVGVANAATGEALTPAHRFRVASHSKTFTVAGIMRLVEAGRLRLDDRAGQYVSGLDAAVAKATIAQLASHTAGIIRDGTDSGQWANRRPFLNEAELRAGLAEAQPIPANTRMKYSNHGYGLLGLIIEAVTGEAYNVWITREVVERLGLEQTQPDAPVGRGVKLAAGHGSQTLLGARFVIPADTPTHALASATGFVSTAGDLVRFFGQLSPQARKSVLSVESRREMTRRHWKIVGSGERHYGLGTIHGDAGAWAWFGHSGGFPGVITQTSVVPGQDITVSALTNAADGPAALLTEGALRMLQVFAAEGPPRGGLGAWNGRWWGMNGAVDLVAVGERVIVANPGQYNPFLDVPSFTVGKDGVGRFSEAGGFAHYGETARLERDKKGRVVAFWMAGHRMVAEDAVRREVTQRYLGG